MENGTPIIFKDIDHKTMKLLDSLLEWRYKNYYKLFRKNYFNKE
jgi:hypothetical protein